MSVTFFVNGSNEDFNLSNANFGRLCSALGIDFSYAGSIDPNDLEKRMDYLAAQLEKNTVGFSGMQILDYFCNLATLVFLARLAHEKISWG